MLEQIRAVFVCRQHCQLLYGIYQRILSDELNLQHIAAQFVRWPLSNDQKEYCIPVCTKLKEQAEKTPILYPPSILVTNLGCVGMTLR
jgi:hypothetical protein